MTSSQPGKTSQELHHDHTTWRDNQIITVRCQWCRYTYTGTAAKARQYAARHRNKHHPDQITHRTRFRHWTHRRREAANT